MTNVIRRALYISPLSNFLVAVIYSYIYSYVFSNHMVGVWGYTLRGSYHALGGFDYIIYLLISALPFVLYKGIRYFASSFSLFIYIFIYIPFLYSLSFFSYPDNIRYPYIVFFFIIMVCYFLTDKYALFKNTVITNKRKIPFSFIPRITIILMIFIVLLNISQLHFVNFFEDAQEMYEYRASANIRAIYILCWLRAVFLPLLMVYYLYKKYYIRSALTFIGFILIFMLDQQKMTILMPFAIAAIVFAIKYYESNFKTSFHLFLIGLFVVIPLFIMRFDENPLASVFSLIFIYRIQCIAGKQMLAYLDFFDIRHNPYTYFSHINIVNDITGMYPYSLSIGEAINNGEANSNATFFLMDGVASAGLMGCVIVGILFVFIKSILNSLSFVYKVPLLTAIFLFPLQSLMNVSLFTSLFTHGMIVLFLILYFVDIKCLRNNKIV